MIQISKYDYDGIKKFGFYYTNLKRIKNGIIDTVSIPQLGDISIKFFKISEMFTIAANCQIIDSNGHDLSFPNVKNRINTKDYFPGTV